MRAVQAGGRRSGVSWMVSVLGCAWAGVRLLGGCFGARQGWQGAAEGKLARKLALQMRLSGWLDCARRNSVAEP